MPRKPKSAPVEAVEPTVVAPVQTVITNCIEGTRLHIGDGRILAFGESADVGEELANLLRERGQAE